MKESIDNNIITLRKELKVTQEEFALALGVTRQTVIAIEKKKYTPSLCLALKVAKYFGKSVEEIFIYTSCHE